MNATALNGATVAAGPGVVLADGGGHFIFLGTGTVLSGGSLPLVQAHRRTTIWLSEDDQFSPILPPVMWLPRRREVGGRVVSSAGVPASYLVRRDRLVDVTFRLYEAEWAAFYNLVLSLQEGPIFTWYPTGDLLAAGQGFEVTLFSPMPGERWAPVRLANYPKVFTITLTFRGVGAVNPWVPFFAEVA